MTRLISAVLILLVPRMALASAIPSIIGDWNGRPAWVSAEHAVDDRGALRESVFTEHDLQQLRAVAPKSPDRCQVYVGRMPEHFEPTSSLSALTDHAAVVVSARIEAGAEGFYFGMPGTLFRVSATYLKGAPPRQTYLFYPRAQIRTAHGFICARPIGFAGDLRPGDRVLWFGMKEPTTFGDQTIAFVDVARELVHEPRSGTIRLPEALKSESGREPAFDEVTRGVESRLKQRPRPSVAKP